jgi:hypothetical protein
MKLRLVTLEMAFKQATEVIEWASFNYFYGQMGAGKSTIARLVDYCFGGELVWTPALQSEFVAASLSMLIGDSDLTLNREANSNQVRARWNVGDEFYEAVVPARSPSGEIIPDTGIEVLSDLIFYLSGKTPPKVRRSKLKEESELERLSIRNLLWYCYLDQDSMDSSFFELDFDANPYKKLKSRDVLRLLVGFHQERVAELEAQLEILRNEKLRAEAGANAIREALSSSDIASEIELAAIRTRLEQDLKDVTHEIEDFRASVRSMRSHAMDELQKRGRDLSKGISELQQALDDLHNILAKDKAHKNELLSLGSRFRRSQSAKEVLAGVEFAACPKCGQHLPERSSDLCALCGQPPVESITGGLDEQAAEQDISSRVEELKELIAQHERYIGKTEREIRELEDEKAVVDTELTRASSAYDSAYLSSALETEKRRSSIQQQLLDLNKLEALVRKIQELEERVHILAGEEQKIRSELRDARAKAEKDTVNLNRLKDLFLDCLLRAKIPGFLPSDVVEMKAPHFLPEVMPAETGDLVVTSFGNLGSGGKKTLFKCCFAVAAHRLATENGDTLPTLLIIDSPMKNISERENREQFEGFHKMLYELSVSELAETQFVLIDKEYSPPPSDLKIDIKVRHMKPDSDQDPPLIRYYRGK